MSSLFFSYSATCSIRNVYNMAASAKGTDVPSIAGGKMKEKRLVYL